MKTKVKYSIGRTVQTAPYESTRIDVGLEMVIEGGDDWDWESAYQDMKGFADQKIEEEEDRWRKKSK